MAKGKRVTIRQASGINGLNSFLLEGRYCVPWVPEAFHTWFPVSVKSSKVTCAKIVWTRAPSLWKRQANNHSLYTKPSRIWNLCHICNNLFTPRCKLVCKCGNYHLFHKFAHEQISCKSIFFVQWTFFKQINWPRDETCAWREIKFHILWLLQILLHSDSFWNWASVGNVSFATYLRSYRHTQVLNSLHRELRKSSVSPIMFC